MSFNKEDKIWWRRGLLAFAEATGYIAFPVIGALYLGQYLDNKYETGSFYFLLITGIAFIISCLGIARVGLKYLKDIDKEIKEKDRKNEDES